MSTSNSILQRLKALLKRILRLNPVPAPRTGGAFAQIPNSVLMPEIARLLSEGHTVTIPLKGNSMRPFLCHMRDKALLVLPENVRVGDPVLAENIPGHYVLHRIVAIDGQRVTLLGDGNLTPEFCTMGDIIALARAFYRKGSDTPDYITSPKWRIYSWCWMRLRPVRRYLLLLHHALFRSMKILD